jgi:hypothetical protein
MLRPTILLLIGAAITAAVTVSVYAVGPALQSAASQVSSAFETVVTLPLPAPDTENLFEAPDGSIYITGMDAKVVWKVTPDRRVDTFATVPSVAFVVGVASTGDGFALTAFGRPFRRPGAAGQPPQIDFSDIDTQIILLDKTGKVTASIPGQKAQAFNGITPAGTRGGIYLVADSNAGTIWQVDAGRKRIELWLKDDLLAPTEAARVGANGIKVHDGWVYVSSRGTMYRVQMGPDGRPRRTLSVFAQGIRTDDFDIAKDGTIYLSSMTKISPRGEVSPFREKVPPGPAVMVSRDGKWLYWPTRGADAPQRLLRTAIP